MQVERFAGKVAVITGGASGLGRGLGEALARGGAKLVVGDIDFAAANALCAELSRAGCSATATRCWRSISSPIYSSSTTWA